jgi:hypothetical protein
MERITFITFNGQRIAVESIHDPLRNEQPAKYELFCIRIIEDAINQCLKRFSDLGYEILNENFKIESDWYGYGEERPNLDFVPFLINRVMFSPYCWEPLT